MTLYIQNKHKFYSTIDKHIKSPDDDIEQASRNVETNSRTDVNYDPIS